VRKKFLKKFPISLSKNSKISPGNKNTGDIRRQTDSHRREREKEKVRDWGVPRSEIKN
jgi:hypothetical protein